MPTAAHEGVLTSIDSDAHRTDDCGGPELGIAPAIARPEMVCSDSPEPKPGPLTEINIQVLS